ncbi:hypothetical protein FCV25MIE_01318 [Fagus crenata]
MASRRGFHLRRNLEEPKNPGPRSYTLHRPIIPSLKQSPQQVLLRHPRVPHSQVPHPDHLLLRRDQRLRFPAGFRSNRRRNSLERGEHHRRLRQRLVVVLRRRLCRSGKDYEPVYRCQYLYGFGPVYIVFGILDSWGFAL